MYPSAIQTTRYIRGGCLCGAVQYAVEDSFAYALNCHCSQCRRATGSAFKSFGGIERSKLSLAPEAGPLLVFGNHDAHDAPSASPSAHIFVGSKAPWHVITDNLPQHPEFP